MSDISTDAPVVDAPVADAPVADAPAAEVDIFDDAATQTFPREYVEKLRRENAEVRTKYAPFRDTFSDVEEDLRDYVLNDIVRPLLTDPASALDELYGIVERIHNSNQTVPKWLEKQIEKAEEAVDEDKPLTVAEWKAIQAKEEAAKAEETKRTEGLKAIMDATTALGYPSTPADDPYGDLASLFAISTNHTKGDLQKAHELRVNRFNEAVEAAVTAKLEEIKTGAIKWPAVSSTGTSPAEEKQEPKTFSEARKRANSRLDRFFQND